MHKRIFKSIGIVAVVAATAVPSALATRVIEVGSLTPLGGVSVKAAPQAVDQSDVFTRYVANHKAALGNVSIPYLSHGIGVDASQFGGTGANSTRVQGSQFITDTLAPGGGTIAAAPAVGGFNWGDAGIGVGGAFGLFLLLTLGAVATQGNRKGPLAA